MKIVFPYPALILGSKQNRVLVISDLHLGWEYELCHQGIHLPSQMPNILNKLLKLINLTKPKMLVILGDVKHTITQFDIDEWKDIPIFFEQLTVNVPQILIIPGNHDGNLEALIPKEVKILSSNGIVIKGIGLLHGHAWPSPEILGCTTLIMGHIHPTIKLPIQGHLTVKKVWLKTKLNTKKIIQSYLKHRKIKFKELKGTTIFYNKFEIKPKICKAIIMPAFNDLIGGKPLNKDYSHNLKLGPIIKFIILNRSEIFLLDGTYLGQLNRL